MLDQDDASAGKWKARYAQLVTEVEALEQSSAQKIDLLQQAALVMGQGASGQDATLDAAIHQFSQVLRADLTAKQLPIQLEALKQKVNKLNQLREERVLQFSQLLLAFTTQIKTFAKHSKAKKSIKAVEKRLNTAKTLDDIKQALQDMLAVQAQLASNNETQTNKQQEPNNKRKGLFSRLFNKEQTNALESTEVVAETSVAETSNEETSNEETNTLEIAPEQAQAGFATVSTEVVAIFIELLASIDMPAEVKELADGLYVNLQNGLTWPEFIPALDDFIVIVNAALERDQQAFEQFLKRLDQQLVFTQDFLQQVGAQFERIDQSATSLNKNIKQQIDSVQEAFEQTDDIDKLKDRVQGRLDTIVSSLGEFQDFQSQQSSFFVSQYDEMQQRLADLESEAQLAKENIEQQRQKLLRDTLTELPNREAYNQRVEEEFARWHRYQRDLSLVVCDIDFFKKVNDAYGHLVGDKVLKLVGRILKQQIRSTDFVARFGGEEFVLLMPETSVANAIIATQKIGKVIEESPFRFKEERLGITLSFGITQFVANDTLELAFERADKALYQAKEAGRNQSCIEEG